ncbi:MAG: metallophosphoesterase family protein, partial [Cypionkella sp.]
MRLGLLGDIHGNADALRAVLGAACTEGIETLCVTGDFVGYYDQPDAVLEMLSQWTYHAVRGNHEDLLNLARRDPVSRASSLAKYGSGLNIALDRLGPHQIDMLVQLPRSLTLSFGP